MRKLYESPELEIEKFRIDTIFTDSSNPEGGGLGDGDTEENLDDLDNIPDPAILDEFGELGEY